MNASMFPLLMLGFFGVTAMIGVASASILMGTPFDVILFVTFGLIVFCVYGINRFTDIEDLLNDPDKRLFFKNNKYLLHVIIGLLVITIGTLYVYEKLTIFHLALIAIGIGYSVRLIPTFNKQRKIIAMRIKDISFLKSISVTLTLGTSFFLINWIAYPQYVTQPTQVLLLIGSCMLVVFINTNFCDIRDVDGDRASAIPTIPSKYGIKATIIHAMIFPTVGWIALVIFMSFNQVISPFTTIFLLLNALYPLLYIPMHFSNKINKKVVSVTADMSVLLFSAGLILLKLLSPGT